jgi:hypothetical protein
LLDPIGIGDSEVRWPLNGQLERTLGAESSPGPLHERWHGEYFLLWREDAGLQTGRDEKLADHAAQSLRLVRDRLEVTTRRIWNLQVRPELRGQCADACQRRLKVVRHAPEEVRLHCGKSIQLVGL